MSMLTLYLIALIIGGTLVVASLLFGGEGEADGDFDHDADLDADVEVSADADHDLDHDAGGGMDALSGWLPIASIRFWIFFLAFFGLTGTTLSAGKFFSGTLIAILSGAVGYVCGASITSAIRKLRRQVVDSSLGEADFIGITATVVVPIAKGKTGKIRFEAKGRVIELMAETDEEGTLDRKQPVMIYGMKDGNVVVSRSEQLIAEERS